MKCFLILPLVAVVLLAQGCGDSPSSGPLGLGIDTTGFDTSVRPQDDLFTYVNGTWVSETDIPSDRSRYGAFDMLREKSEADVRAIVEDALAGEVGDIDAQKIADLYTSFLDSTRTNEL
ncbi:MAG: hypothetical protein R3284_10325, partial [Rubricoccaceae bacterium]|nr:hypothetical protein [Rubricoccaceae bacterium]